MSEYDDQLNLFNELKWYPWIGIQYKNTRLFVMGESHYEDGEFWQQGNILTTRIITQKRYDGIRGDWKLHRNVENIVLNKPSNSIEEVRSVWDKIVYWNLVQRLLDSRAGKDRPTFEDFTSGWTLFFQLYEIFKPRFCLVLGKAPMNSLGYLLANQQLGKWRLSEKDFDTKKVFSVCTDETEIQFLFISHPSGSYGFNCEEWAEMFHQQTSIKL